MEVDQMKVNVIKMDLNKIWKLIVEEDSRFKRKTKYIVMSSDTLNAMGADLPNYGNKTFGPELYGIKIAINNTLKLGEVDIV